MIDAVFVPVSVGELDQARTLTRSLQPGMLLLADRNYAAADLLIRAKANRRLTMIARLPDGSWLSTIGALTVQVVEARISITTTAGTHTGDYRLITTLLSPDTHPAADRIYHERWEIETAYLELKSSILAGRVLRARTPDGIDQEIHALLIVYQLLRTAMTDATDSQPGLDPDQASFTTALNTALNTARDQIVHAAGVIAEAVIDLVGVIGFPPAAVGRRVPRVGRLLAVEMAISVVFRPLAGTLADAWAKELRAVAPGTPLGD